MKDRYRGPLTPNEMKVLILRAGEPTTIRPSRRIVANEMEGNSQDGHTSLRTVRKYEIRGLRKLVNKGALADNNDYLDFLRRR